MEKEIWYDIPDYKGKYQISTLGNIKSIGGFKESYKTDKYYTPYGKKDIIMTKIIKSTGYSACTLYKNKIGKQELIHRLMCKTFFGVVTNKDFHCDHINGIKCDNRLSNLRIVTQRENSSICYKSNSNKKTSKYVGVSLYKKYNNWVSKININGKSIHLGYFNTEIEAANAYQDKLKEIKFADKGIVIDFPSIDNFKE